MKAIPDLVGVSSKSTLPVNRKIKTDLGVPDPILDFVPHAKYVDAKAREGNEVCKDRMERPDQDDPWSSPRCPSSSRLAPLMTSWMQTVTGTARAVLLSGFATEP